MTRSASSAPSGSGRSATCRRCTDSGVVNLCSCLLDCGHPKCTGTKNPAGITPVPTRKGHTTNPEGFGSGRNQYTKGKAPIRPSPARDGGTKPPKLPKEKRRRWGRGRPA